MSADATLKMFEADPDAFAHGSQIPSQDPTEPALSALTPAQEKREARALSPAVARPTLAMAVLLPAFHWAVVGFGLAGRLPLWACAGILTATAYAQRRQVHEESHGNLVPG